MSKPAKKLSMVEEPTHLLWTGGWDSTFRLLYLLLAEGKVVQPHYVVTSQACTGKEINTINDIRREVLRRYPEVEESFLPVLYPNIQKVEKDENIKNGFDKIKSAQYVSPQYLRFARYCKQNNLSELEVGIEKNSRSHHMLKEYITENNGEVKVDKNKSPESYYNVFKYFSFPLLKYDKLDMEAIARQKDWIEIMDMAWFCRRPKNGRPCGFCGPCTDVVVDGLAWRLPLRSRIKAYIQLPFRKWWRRNYQKQSDGMLKHVPKLFKHKF